MRNARFYGKAPFAVAVLHGGPGAPGEVAPVARELSREMGVIEPMQKADSIGGQVEELRSLLSKRARLPVNLVGHSWGAWLGFIIAARRPELVRKLVLINSGPFEQRYAAGISETRRSRMNEDERIEMASVMGRLGHLGVHESERLLRRLGELSDKTDQFDPLPHEDDVIEFQGEVFRKVWREAEALRAGGELLELGRRIACPVVAIHGDHDPHPAEGVEEPLSRVLNDFHFILLRNCGHVPWIERQAKEEFYTALREAILP